jgi:two-component system OmpR family response regulator
MRVLVAEDEPKTAGAVARGLRHEGYAVDVVTNGDDAVFQARVYEYDAVVLDVMLPGRDGFAVCKALRNENVWCPVLMLTAREHVDDRIRGLDAGADDDLTIDPATRTVANGGGEVRLTPREFALLEFLGRHAGEVVSRTQLREHVWDERFPGESNIIDVYVARLRAKLRHATSRAEIHTVRGAGYMLRMT